MTDLVNAVTEVVALNDGEVAGKTRLQKIFYLLEAMQIGFGIDFDYHKHGPFSAELAFAADDAVALGCLSAQERPGFHLIPYTVFRIERGVRSPLSEDHRTMRASAGAENHEKVFPGHIRTRCNSNISARAWLSRHVLERSACAKTA